jgi:hypothetical protein
MVPIRSCSNHTTSLIFRLLQNEEIINSKFVLISIKKSDYNLQLKNFICFFLLNTNNLNKSPSKEGFCYFPIAYLSVS